MINIYITIFSLYKLIMFNTKYSYKDINQYNYLSKVKINYDIPDDKLTEEKKQIYNNLIRKHNSIINNINKKESNHYK